MARTSFVVPPFFFFSAACVFIATSSFYPRPLPTCTRRSIDTALCRGTVTATHFLFGRASLQEMGQVDR